MNNLSMTITGNAKTKSVTVLINKYSKGTNNYQSRALKLLKIGNDYCFIRFCTLSK